MVLRIVIPFFLVLWVGAAPVQAAGDQNSALTDIQYMPDSTDLLDLEAARKAFDAGRFQPLKGHGVHFGYTKTTYWFRITIQDESHSAWRTLELSNPRLGRVTLYYPTQEGAYIKTAIGIREPFWERLMPGLTPAFPVRVVAGQAKEFYVQVENYGAMQFEFRLWSLNEHNRHSNHVLAVALALAGALLLLAVLNIFVFFHLRQPGYLWIGLFMAACTLRQMSVTATANMFLWPNSTLWAQYAITTTGLLALAVGAFAANRLLELDKFAPRIATANIGVALTAVAGGLASLTGAALPLYLMVVCTLLVPCLVIVGALSTLRSQSGNGKRFLLIWGPVVASALIATLVAAGYLPPWLPTVHLVDFALLLGGLCSSYTLTSQVKIQAQRQQHLLEAQVRERTADLEAALEAVRTLRGLVPICSCCKKIRDDDGYWQHLETYLKAHTNADFSHGICPDCAVVHYPGYFPPPDSTPVESQPNAPVEPGP